MVVPEEEYKNMKNTKQIIPELEKLKQKTWLQIKTPVDILKTVLILNLICIRQLHFLIQFMTRNFRIASSCGNS
jgi:hypothetical protein